MYALFFDVPADHPYADAIDLLTREGVLSGYENRSFRPDIETNRAEFTKMIVSTIFPQTYIDGCIDSLQEEPEVIPDLLFSDVSHNAWYAPYICTAWINGIVSGYPDGRFRPEEGVRFVEAAKMLSLGFGLTGFELPELGAANVLWYQPYVEFLAAENAIPLSIGNLAQNVSRGEVAEMMYRLRNYPLTPPPVDHRASRSTEEVTHPVEWTWYENPDYTYGFHYPNVWPEPHTYAKGHYDGRIPYIRAEWTEYFGPNTKECPGQGTCIERDMWFDGYDTEDASIILDIIENDEFFVEIEEETIINGLPTLIVLEDVRDCLDKRSFHFGKRWIYSISMRCAGQNEELYDMFEQIVRTVEEIDERPPEHRK